MEQMPVLPPDEVDRLPEHDPFVCNGNGIGTVLKQLNSALLFHLPDGGEQRRLRDAQLFRSLREAHIFTDGVKISIWMSVICAFSLYSVNEKPAAKTDSAAGFFSHEKYQIPFAPVSQIRPMEIGST